MKRTVTATKRHDAEVDVNRPAARPQASGGASRDGEGSLREKARDAILNGQLPTGSPRRTFAGPGGGTACCVCREPIKQTQVEYETEFRLNGALANYHLHLRCFAAWEMERRNIEGISRAATAS